MLGAEYLIFPGHTHCLVCSVLLYLVQMPNYRPIEHLVQSRHKGHLLGHVVPGSVRVDTRAIFLAMLSLMLYLW